MTALVLMLSGMTAGDGGVGMGAATAPLTEPLRLDFSREWEGTIQTGPRHFVPVRLSRGRMTTVSNGRRSTEPFALTLSHGGVARGSWGVLPFHGTYRVEGGRLLLCVVSANDPRPGIAFTYRDGVLLTLQPAARRP